MEVTAWLLSLQGMVWSYSSLSLSLSDRLSEGELGGPVMLQPGGAACSAVLQPGPYPPQPQKQLHVPSQRCSSTHQVSFSHQLSCTTDSQSTSLPVRLMIWHGEDLVVNILCSYLFLCVRVCAHARVCGFMHGYPWVVEACWFLGVCE